MTGSRGESEVGEELKAAHERLANHGDGTFNRWVKERCGFSHATAYKAIAAFDVFGGEDCKQYLQSFDASALYLLSAPSCPEEATAEAIERAEKGERITHKLAKEIKGDTDVDAETNGTEMDEQNCRKKHLTKKRFETLIALAEAIESHVAKPVREVSILDVRNVVKELLQELRSLNF